MSIRLIPFRLVICFFIVETTSAIGTTYSAKFFSSYTGLNFSPLEMKGARERIVNLPKAYNPRESLTRSDDAYPARFFVDRFENGSPEGPMLSKDDLEQLPNAYYDLRGWNKETGNPTKEKLEELGSESVAFELVASQLL